MEPIYMSPAKADASKAARIVSSDATTVTAPEQVIAGIISPSTASRVMHMVQTDAFNFNKEQYEELYSTQRYLGTMRTRVAWAPATLTVAIVGFFMKDSIHADHTTLSFWLLLAVMYNVLCLILMADRYFVREQKIMSMMCRDCENLWIKSGRRPDEIDTGPREIMSYSTLYERAQTNYKNGRRRIFSDKSNGLLAFYFIVISTIPWLVLMPPIEIPVLWHLVWTGAGANPDKASNNTAFPTPTETNAMKKSPGATTLSK
jgi:hypothetical protein